MVINVENRIATRGKPIRNWHRNWHRNYLATSSQLERGATRQLYTRPPRAAPGGNVPPAATPVRAELFSQACAASRAVCYPAPNGPHISSGVFKINAHVTMPRDISRAHPWPLISMLVWARALRRKEMWAFFVPMHPPAKSTPLQH